MNDWSGRLRDSRGHTNKHIRLISARIKQYFQKPFVTSYQRQLFAESNMNIIRLIGQNRF